VSSSGRVANALGVARLDRGGMRSQMLFKLRRRVRYANDGSAAFIILRVRQDKCDRAVSLCIEGELEHNE
jgi:hypothetical protein